VLSWDNDPLSREQSAWGPLPKPTKKQKGVVMFDPPSVSHHCGRGKNYYGGVPNRITKSFLKVIPADAVFYVQQGRVKAQGQIQTGQTKRSSPSWGAGDLPFAEACLIGHNSLPGDGYGDCT